MLYCFLLILQLAPEFLNFISFCVFLNLSSGEEPRLSLNQFSDGNDRLRITLLVEDHSGNDPHLVPGFLRLCSGKFPEQFRSVPAPVRLREIGLV